MTDETFNDVFNQIGYAVLHDIVFRGDYPGYKPTVTEIPNCDGKADADKRYAHVALKYLPGWGTAIERRVLVAMLEEAHGRAEMVYDALGGPPEFRPDIRYGALRVLEYPPGAISHEHTDFDLFTLALYRDRPECFRRAEEWTDIPTAALALNRGLHIGDLGEEIGLGKATRHSVVASDQPQHSIVYFAIPDHEARIGEEFVRADGFTVRPTVRDWLNERMARSRTAFTAYQKAGV